MLGWLKKLSLTNAEKRKQERRRILWLMMDTASQLENWSVDCDWDGDLPPLEYDIHFVVETLVSGLLNGFGTSDPSLIRDLADVIEEKITHDAYITKYNIKKNEEK